MVNANGKVAGERLEPESLEKLREEFYENAVRVISGTAGGSG